jgi:hypothetical protein
MLAAAAACVLLTVPAASAANSSAPVLASHSSYTVKKTAAMQKVRVTKLISGAPDKAGQVKVELANGAIVPIPQATEKTVMSRAAQEAAHPDGVVSGNCGSSFITVTEKPNHYPVAMRTGFTVIAPAIGYDWSAFVGGPDYLYDYESGGGLFFDSSWEGGYQSSDNEAEGIYLAEVDPAGSDAVLFDGTVCYSGGPIDVEYLTVPEAACLNARPAAAVTSGGGWIDNDTQKVAHRNITTTPNGPAARPTQGTACLTLTLGKGTDGSGNITGWQDAQLFATRHGYKPASVLARCHVIAQVVGGKGGQANLFPCWQVGTNTGAGSMRMYETMVRAALTAANLGPNGAIYYEVSLKYKNGASTIPEWVTMTATVERANGTTRTLFSNKRVYNIHDGLNLGN